VLSAFFFTQVTLNPHPYKSIFPQLTRVACVGDSITEGTYYPFYLQEMMGENYTVRNFGAGASTILRNSVKPYIMRPVFQSAVSFQAHIVIIMLGTNDAIPAWYEKIENFVEDYKTLIRQFDKGNTQVWLVRPPPIYDDSLGPKASNLVEGVLPRIEQVAGELDLPLIDVYSQMFGHPEYFTDGVHPTAEGADVIATTIYQALLNQADN
jgi:lysophospholipase L1-like esterase